MDFEAKIDMDILNDKALLRRAKTMGFSDKMIAKLINKKDNLDLSENDIYHKRQKLAILSNFNEVDTCAGEFEAFTPYYYSSFSPMQESFSEEKKQKNEKKVMIIGSGPNRIGQGIEFDYACVHASFALRDLGVKTIMYNCNPETVSTDYDTSDKLYFEPIEFEYLRAVIEREKPEGLIIHFGGQTPLKFAKKLSIFGTKIIGTSARVIDLAEDRKKFAEFMEKLGIKQPKNHTATSINEALSKASDIGYPVLVRPSYVLGGRAMRVVYNEDELSLYMKEAIEVSDKSPILIDKFLDNATELDVDAISDGKDVYIGGIMEHIEEAGIHSGDSACSLPPYNIDEKTIELIEQKTKEIALNLGVIGLLNIQFALHNNELFMIEVNPRASRTVPFVSKATGIALAKVATRVMYQGNLKEALKFYDKYGVVEEKNGILKAKNKKHSSVKEAVFPFAKLSSADLELGPEMRSTGEVMGISKNFYTSYAKSQISAFNDLPSAGTLFISLKQKDKKYAKDLAKAYSKLGFKIIATSGTAAAIKEAKIECDIVYKISEGRPNIEDKLKNEEINLVINTSDENSVKSDTKIIRSNITRFKIPYFTNIRSALIAAKSLQNKEEHLAVKSLQEYLK